MSGRLIRILSWTGLGLLTLLTIIVAIANRDPVIFSLDPFGSATPALTLRLPLFLALFGFAFLGAVTGSVMTWVGQLKWHSRAKAAEKDLKDREKRLKAVEGKALALNAERLGAGPDIGAQNDPDLVPGAGPDSPRETGLTASPLAKVATK